MTRRIAMATATVALLCVCGAAFAGTPQGDAGAPQIEGRYLEARSCDVWVAACFANSEVGVTGDEATMAWDVTQGSWNGVALDGLQVVAVVSANDTLGNVAGKTFATKSVMYVDADASETQRMALVDLAKTMSNGLVNDVVSVTAVPISFRLSACTNEGCASLKAGDAVEIATRCLHEHDKHCGNETAWYQPLTAISDAKVLFAERDRFSGDGLGMTWDNSVRSSAYLGTFAR